MSDLETSGEKMFRLWQSAVCVTVHLFSCAPVICADGINNGPDQEKVPLYIAGFYSQGENWDGSGVIVAMDLAFELVNNRTDILPGYELKPLWYNSVCNGGKAARTFFDLINTPPQKIAILGPPCSVSRPVVEASQYWNLIAMGYSAEAKALSNRRKHPLFFRTNPIVNGKEQIPMALLVKRYGWKQIALVAEDFAYISSLSRFIHSLLSEAGVTPYSEYVRLGHSVQSQVENIRLKRFKVVFLNTREMTAQLVFCEFFKQGWFGEGHVWFIPHYFKSNLWEVPNEQLDCTQDEMRTIIGGAYYLLSRPLVVPRTTSEIISHLTVDKFNAEILRRISWPTYASYNVSVTGYEKFAFDAVWALALMLNQSAQVLEARASKGGKKVHLEDFTYENSGMAELFLQAVLDVKFLGFSGDVYFTENENDDRFKLFEILQRQGVCEAGWSVNHTDCYLVLSEETAFQDAQMACQNRSAELAAIHTWKELDFVTSLWKLSENVSTSQFWLATSDYLKVFGRADGIIPATDGIMKQIECLYFDFTLNSSFIDDCQTTRPFICKKQADFALHSLGWYDDRNGNMTLYQDIIWPGGVVPADVISDVKQPMQFSYIEEMLPSTLHIIITSATVFGVVIALLFLAMNIYFSDQLSNSKLDNLILLAAILALLSAPLTISEILPQTSEDFHLKVCYIQVWLESVAFVTGVGTIVTQLWRVYQQSIVTKLYKSVGDKKLLITVLILVAADTGLLAGHVFISPFEIADVTISTEKTDSADTNDVIIKFTKTCMVTGQFFHIIGLFADKILLVLACLFFSYETRMVENSFSENTKWLVLAFYNITIFSTIRFTLRFLLKSHPITQYMFLASLNIISATATIFVIFIPKVLQLCGITKSTPHSVQERPPSYSNQIVPTSSPTGQEDVTLNQMQTLPHDIRRRQRYLLRVPPALREENLRLWRKLKQLEQLAEEKGLVHDRKPAI